MFEILNVLLGTRDGQTTMVRKMNGSVEAYEWSAAEGQWNKIGDVVGGVAGSPQTSGKQLHKGKVRGDKIHSCITPLLMF